MLRNRLVHTVTVSDDTLGTTDIFGNPAVSASTSTDYDAWVEPLASTENLVNRDTTISLWRITLPPDAVILSTSTVEYDDMTFRVNGKPRTVHNSRGVHHIEADLQLVEAG